MSPLARIHFPAWFSYILTGWLWIHGAAPNDKYASLAFSAIAILSQAIVHPKTAAQPEGASAIPFSVAWFRQRAADREFRNQKSSGPSPVGVPTSAKH